jgi:hypothetical protein
MSSHSRTFAFEAGPYKGTKPAISCDGVVAGASLDLSHWSANRTPARFKADTSTEIALNFVRSREAIEEWSDAVVINNHFDTDGALSSWVLLEPEKAEPHRALLIAAAEAGDFDEWPATDRGLWLDAAVRALAANASGDQESYAIVLPKIAELIATLDQRRDLWGREWDALQAAVDDEKRGRVTMERVGAVGLVTHAVGQNEIPGALIARRLRPGARRYLLAFATPDGRFSYRYERPRYAWAVTVVRPPIPAPSTSPLLAALGSAWTDENVPGMSGIVQTRAPIAESPNSVLEILRKIDAA